MPSNPEDALDPIAELRAELLAHRLVFEQIVMGLMLRQPDPMASLKGLAEAITKRLDDFEQSPPTLFGKALWPQVRAQVDELLGPIVAALAKSAAGG